MTDLVALNSQTHRALRVAVTRARSEHANVNVVPAIPREFPRLLAQYPIFFTKSAESGRFEPAALLGFAGGENLFLSEGSWDAAYVPLQIQRQPFALIPRRGDAARLSPTKARETAALRYASAIIATVPDPSSSAPFQMRSSSLPAVIRPGAPGRRAPLSPRVTSPSA